MVGRIMSSAGFEYFYGSCRARSPLLVKLMGVYEFLPVSSIIGSVARAGTKFYLI